ncbi:MAG: glutathione S-transferase family protein [Alphaproteobacteria bacterium]|nr:glutathione S-transferase family protein [Alphaproteobacteria bacterium]
MTEQAKPQLFELISTNGLALSPWCWHVRMAMAHKGINAEIIQGGFTQKAQLEALGGKSYPLLKASDDPALFPGGESGQTHYRFLHRYVQTIVLPTLAKMIMMDIPDLLEGEDRAYFVSSREARFGKPLAEVCAGREEMRPTLQLQLDPFRKAMESGGFVNGSAPAMSDYLLFGILQWARVSSAFQLLEDNDVITSWMETMLDLFDGLGRGVPSRSAS